MALPVDRKGLPSVDELLNEEVDTGVSLEDLQELLLGAGMIDWTKAPRALLLEFCEESLYIMQKLAGAPEQNHFEEAIYAEIA